MSDRGIWRAIYTALFQDADYQRLTPHARLVLLTLRLGPLNNAVSVIPFYSEPLQQQTGLTAKELDQALAELQRGRRPWVFRADGLVWIRNGLRYDPNVNLDNGNHRRWIDRTIAGLPRVPLMRKFLKYYNLDGGYHPEDHRGDHHRDHGGDSREATTPIPNTTPKQRTTPKRTTTTDAAAFALSEAPAASDNGRTGTAHVRDILKDFHYGPAFNPELHNANCVDGSQGRCWKRDGPRCSAHEAAASQLAQGGAFGGPGGIAP